MGWRGEGGGRRRRRGGGGAGLGGGWVGMLTNISAYERGLLTKDGEKSTPCCVSEEHRIKLPL